MSTTEENKVEIREASEAEEDNQTQADTDRKRILLKGILGGIVLVLVALAIVGIVFIVKSDSTSCALIDLRPEYNEIGVKNYITSDHEAIANFAGFLRYELELNSSHPDRVFVPLEMEHLYVNHPSERIQLLTFGADCAEITLQLVKSGSNTYLENIQVELKLPNGRRNSCSIELSDTYTPEGTHYYCDNLHRLLCTDKSRYGKTNSTELVRNFTVATLYIFRLEFEIDGNPSVIKQGRYSTARDFCVKQADPID